MKFLIAVDGAAGLLETHAEYAESHWDSFVRRISRRGTGRSWYVHASNIGFGSMRIRARDIAEYLQRHSSAGDEVNFAGYSRGSAIALLTANLLANSSWFSGTIKCIGLFDAVANDGSVEAECRSSLNLPNTTVYHARRAFDADFIPFPRLEIRCPNHVQMEYAASHSEMGGSGDPFCLPAYEWISRMLTIEEVIR